MRPTTLLPLTAEQREMVEQNLGLCFTVAGKLIIPSLSYDERVSSCYLALCHAIRTYDAAKGSFLSHMFRWSRSMIQVDIRQKLDLVHTPRRYKTTPLRRDAMNVDCVPTSKQRSWGRIESRLSLPLRTRVMLRLHCDESWTYGEIGRVFQISRQAVNDSIRRGLDRLLEKETP